MAGYIGQAPANKFLTLDKQTFTTSATDTYSLNRSVSSANEIELFLNNVRQEPIEAYTVSGLTLTLASAITSSDTMYCIYQGKAIGTVSPSTNSVSNDMLVNSSVTVNGTSISLGGSETITAGKIGQVIQSTYTSIDAQGTSAGTFYGVGAGVNITPTSTSSKILVMVNLSTGFNSDGNSITRLIRGIGGSDTGLLVSSGANLLNGTFGGFFHSDANRLTTINFSYLDSPSTTSQCTYTTQVATNSSTTIYINRTVNNNSRGASTMICMEVL